MAEKALANNRNLETRIAHALEAAGLALRPAEWLLHPRGDHGRSAASSACSSAAATSLIGAAVHRSAL